MNNKTKAKKFDSFYFSSLSLSLSLNSSNIKKIIYSSNMQNIVSKSTELAIQKYERTKCKVKYDYVSNISVTYRGN